MKIGNLKFTRNPHSNPDHLHLSVDGHSIVTAVKVAKTDRLLLCRAYRRDGKVVAERSFPLGEDVQEVLSLWWCPQLSSIRV